MQIKVKEDLRGGENGFNCQIDQGTLLVPKELMDIILGPKDIETLLDYLISWSSLVKKKARMVQQRISPSSTGTNGPFGHKGS